MNSDLKTLSEGEIDSQHSYIKVLPVAKKRKPPKNKNLNKSDLGVNFIAPDGGWGWIVVIAAGLSILVTFGALQECLPLYQERLADSRSQMTTILYVKSAASTCTALLNGAIFRRFTFRKISLVGAIFTFVGLALTAFTGSFMFNLLTLSIMCGIGESLILASSYISVSTYFSENRLTAFACMSSIGSLGPLFLPHLTTFLIDEYGVSGAVLFFASLTLHNLACSLAYQPVKLHSKKQPIIEMDEIRPLNIVFGSRQMAKLSALENSTNSNLDLNNLHPFSTNSGYPMRVPKNSFASFEPLSRSIPKIILPDETEYFESPHEFPHHSPAEENTKQKHSILQRISSLLDLDLLSDFSFVNLALGLAITRCLELNSTFLIQNILDESGYYESQRTTAISLLFLCDTAVKISIAIISRRKFRCIKKVVLLCALIGICIGRTILVFFSNFTVALICIGWIGLFNGVLGVFWWLILPSCLPLKRLPAAIGFVQGATYLFHLIFGQFEDLFVDTWDYSLKVHFINGLCVCVLCSWLGEYLWRRKRKIILLPPIK